jgi:hypothetical protein
MRASRMPLLVSAAARQEVGVTMSEGEKCLLTAMKCLLTVMKRNAEMMLA